MNALETIELMLQAARVAQAERSDSELRPAEWMALRFIARANEFSCTPSALADFQATTRATASQSIKQLEAGGFIIRRQSKKDGRSFSLILTDKGREALRHDPIDGLIRAFDGLPLKSRIAMHEALRQVLADLSVSGAHRHFDVCKDCVFLADDSNSGGSGKKNGLSHGNGSSKDSSKTDSAFRCRLYRVPISYEATGLLCADFQSSGKA
jgi:DNA-binding MarR family transcriptional regulator